MEVTVESFGRTFEMTAKRVVEQAPTGRGQPLVCGDSVAAASGDPRTMSTPPNRRSARAPSL